MGEPKRIIMLVLSKAFGSVDREILRAIMFKKGIPLQLISRMEMGHGNT